jgi:hypothetical protein
LFTTKKTNFGGANSEEHFLRGEQIITEILLEFKEEKSTNK